MRTIGKAALALVAVPAVLGCAYEILSPLPPGSKPFVAPAAYALWWQEVETCSGRSGRLASVQWYVVPEAGSLPSLGKGVDGYWTPVGNRIVMAGREQMDGEMVRHEMLHALLGPEANGHPRDQFLGRCGGVVACDDKCVSDAGPPPPVTPGTPVVTEDSLVLTAEVEPQEPRLSAFSGYFTITLSARNPASHPVIVRLHPPRPTIPAITFSYVLRGSGLYMTNNVRVFDPADSVFAPGETKRQVFDLTVQDANWHGEVPVGDVTVTGAYGWRDMPPFQFTVGP